jgi:hypothetical protein
LTASYFSFLKKRSLLHYRSHRIMAELLISMRILKTYKNTEPKTMRQDYVNLGYDYQRGGVRVNTYTTAASIIAFLR